MSDQKIAETFNMGTDGLEEHQDTLSALDIPDNPTLDDIARISLEVFSDSIRKLSEVPAPYRARSLEVSKQYLDLSKDAIHKKEDLKQKDKKLQIEEQKVNNHPKTGESSQGTVSRMALAKSRKKKAG